MSLSNSISRFAEYYRRHGFRATIARAAVAARRKLFSSGSVLFYCDLSRLSTPPAEPPSFLKIERKRGEAELSPEDLHQMTSFWNPKLALRIMHERFDKGASVWLIRCHGRLAGYGWTLQGATMEPHYFPMGIDDVAFLDFHVFPKFRGRAMDWFLIRHILHQLAGENLGRAFGEAGEWNQASLASFKMSPFRRLGSARKFTVFRHTMVHWRQDEGASLPNPIPHILH